MSIAPDARTQAAAILVAEAQRLAAFIPPPCDPDAPLHVRAAAMGTFMRMDEIVFLTALAAYLRGEDPPEGNPYKVTVTREQP